MTGRASERVEALGVGHDLEQRRRSVEDVDLVLDEEPVHRGAVALRRVVGDSKGVAEQQGREDLLNRGVEAVGRDERHAERT